MAKKTKKAPKKEYCFCKGCGAKEEVSEKEVGQIYSYCFDCYVNIDFQTDNY